MMSSLEYRGFSIRFTRTGRPPWSSVRWEAEALAWNAPKFWSASYSGRDGKSEAMKDIKHRIDIFHMAAEGREVTEKALANSCTCRHVTTVAGRSYFGGIDDCPVHGFGKTKES